MQKGNTIKANSEPAAAGTPARCESPLGESERLDPPSEIQQQPSPERFDDTCSTIPDTSPQELLARVKLSGWDTLIRYMIGEDLSKTESEYARNLLELCQQAGHWEPTKYCEIELPETVLAIWKSPSHKPAPHPCAERISQHSGDNHGSSTQQQDERAHIAACS